MNNCILFTYEQATIREKKIFIEASEPNRSIERGKRKRKIKFKKNENFNDDLHENGKLKTKFLILLYSVRCLIIIKTILYFI